MPIVAAVSLKLKSSAATVALSALAPAAVFQAEREISQIACPLDGAAQVPQAAPVAERTVAPDTASDDARPLPVPKTWTATLSMSA